MGEVSGSGAGTVATDARTALSALVRAGQTVASAESLTGGMVGAVLTAVPGASAAYVGGVLAYATRLKVDLLGVPEWVVAEHGAVSEECATAMADGVRRRLGAHWGLATTGVAGPDRQEGKPAGRVHVAVAGPEGVSTLTLALGGDREAVRSATVAALLRLLVETLGETPAEG